jgi:hypothetical protein
MVMKFFKLMLPIVAVVSEYFTKTGRIGYDVNTNTVKYKTPNGVKEIATTEQVGGGGVTPQWFVGQVVQSLGPYTLGNSDFDIGTLGGSATIGEEHLPEIKPTFKVSLDIPNGGMTLISVADFSGTGAIIGIGSDTGNNADLDCINAVGNENPVPFMQPYIAVNMLVFTGVYV